MKLSDLKNLHVYQLVRDVENPKPDKRVNSDSHWEKWPGVEKGARFQFVLKGVDIDRRAAHLPCLRLFDSRYPSLGERSIAHRDVATLDKNEQAQQKFLADIIEALEPAPITLDVFFAMRDRETRGGEVYRTLESMLRHNVITWDQLAAGLQKRAEDDAVPEEQTPAAPVYVPKRVCAHCGKEIFSVAWANEVGALTHEEYDSAECAETRLVEWARDNITRRKRTEVLEGPHFIVQVFNPDKVTLEEEIPCATLNDVARELAGAMKAFPNAGSFRVVNSNGSPLSSEQMKKVSP